MGLIDLAPSPPLVAAPFRLRMVRAGALVPRPPAIDPGELLGGRDASDGPLRISKRQSTAAANRLNFSPDGAGGASSSRFGT